MPVALVTPVLAAGLLPIFVAATAPTTTREAATRWAQAYVNYAVAGGVVTSPVKLPSFANALTSAFDPTLGGGGPALFIGALAGFWIGLVVPAQAGVVSLFTPGSVNINSPQGADATPQQQANDLARIIAGLTLRAVKVQPYVPGPPIPLV